MTSQEQPYSLITLKWLLIGPDKSENMFLGIIENSSYKNQNIPWQFLVIIGTSFDSKEKSENILFLGIIETFPSKIKMYHDSC